MVSPAPTTPVASPGAETSPLLNRTRTAVKSACCGSCGKKCFGFVFKIAAVTTTVAAATSLAFTILFAIAPRVANAAKAVAVIKAYVPLTTTILASTTGALVGIIALAIVAKAIYNKVSNARNQPTTPDVTPTTTKISEDGGAAAAADDIEVSPRSEEE